VLEEARAEMYVAHSQLPEHIRSAPRGMTLVVKAAGDPAQLASPLRAAVRAVDPNLPVSDVRAMSDVTLNALAQPRFVTALLASFAVVALVLAAVGIYGTVSLLAAERSREMSIRLAIGAAPAALVGLVLREGARMTAIGLALGAIVSAALARLLAGMVYGVSLADPLTLLIVPALLGGVSLAASLVPARRAAATSPADVLK
jgi:ABC-type lipoprotein release transport system permease subunit